MSAVNIIDISNLNNFHKDKSFLNIIERDKPPNSRMFFKELLLESINISKTINSENSIEDIKNLLTKMLSKKIQNNIFFKIWIKDMSNICKIFSNIIGKNEINFSLKTSRACKRYHIDNVSIRLLVTYYGKGTEWLPNHACDYAAYYRGDNNDKIVLNKNERKFIKTWNIAIFKGQKLKNGKNGILHRTPDQALNKPSLLMCLDIPSKL